MPARAGEKHHKARLTQKDVDQIRELYYDHGIGIYSLAEKFELPQATIADVVHYRTWSKKRWLND